MVSLADADVAGGVATFYELLKLRQEQQQDSEDLTSDDVDNLAEAWNHLKGKSCPRTGTLSEQVSIAAHSYRP